MQTVWTQNLRDVLNLFVIHWRRCRRQAFKANLISDDAWMDMLKVRNELAHDYDCEIVKKHCNTIVEKYIDLFYEFEEVVKKLGD